MAKETNLEIQDEVTTQEWMSKYPRADNSHVLKVHELRKFNCELVMHLHPDNIKNKNFNWRIRPHGWPADVPFVDPNNKADGSAKPTKSVLECMYKYLVERYKTSKSNENTYVPDFNEEDLPCFAGDYEEENSAVSCGFVPVHCESSVEENQSAFCYGDSLLWPFDDDLEMWLASDPLLRPFDDDLEMWPSSEFNWMRYRPTSCMDGARTFFDNCLGIKPRFVGVDDLLGESQVIYRNDWDSSPGELYELDIKVSNNPDPETWVDPTTGDKSYPLRNVLEKKLGNNTDTNKIHVEKYEINKTFNEVPEVKGPKRFLDVGADDDPPGKRMKGTSVELSHNGLQEDAWELCQGGGRELRPKATGSKVKPRRDPKKTKVKMKSSTRNV